MTDAAAPPTQFSARWSRNWIAPALLALLVFATFARSLAGGFVFDDTRFVVQNPNVEAPESWVRLFTDPSTADPGAPPTLVRPLRTAEFALDRALLGPDAWGFHLHSLLWHVTAAVLLLLVLRQLGLDGRIAFAAALVWAVHPAQVESVAWISSRGDVACGACSLAAVLFALRSTSFDRDLALSLVFAAVALLYKETGLALPFVLVVLRWAKVSRAPVWPHFAVLAAWFAYRAAVQGGPGDHGVTFALGGGTTGTVATMMRAFGFYLADTLLPTQSLDWYLPPSTSFDSRGVIPWMAAHAALTGSAVVLRRRAPLWTVGVGWFYGFLAPVSNVLVFLGIPTAERFLYLPLAGAAIALGWGLTRAPRGALAAVLVAAGALAGASFQRTAMWRDHDTLWRTVLGDHDSPRAMANAGERLRLEGLALRDELARLPDGPERAAADARRIARLEDSLEHFHRALALWYGFELTDASGGQFAGGAETNASNVCWLLGRDSEALFHAEVAIRIDEAMPGPHYDRALALLELGFAPQAMNSMQRAREQGLVAPESELAAFFVRGARACESDGLSAVAEWAYGVALAAAPDEPARRDVQAMRDTLRAHPRPTDSTARETQRLAAMDEALARLPRSCPARSETNRPR